MIHFTHPHKARLAGYSKYHNERVCLKCHSEDIPMMILHTKHLDTIASCDSMKSQHDLIVFKKHLEDIAIIGNNVDT